MAKAKQTPVATATGATPFPTAEELHATTQAVLNAPPKGINWDGFDSDLTNAFKAQHVADESLRVLAGKMYQCGVRFDMFNHVTGKHAGEMNDKSPVCIELRRRLAKRLSDREQILISMDRWNAAALDTVEKAVRNLASKRIDKMVSLMRKHLKTVEGIETGRDRKTLEERLYALCTKIREEIVAADPNVVKFDINEAREACDTLRDMFDV